MTTVVYYLLKVVLCSGILALYYHLFLRNKQFHQWNRFYLLLSVVLSLLLPLLQFRLITGEDDAANARLLLQSLQKADNTLEEFVAVSGSRFALEHWLLLAFWSICFFFLTKFSLSLLRIRQLIQAHPVRFVNGIKFINTNVPGTPFSFLRYIFWNKEISLQTATGQQIFEHERVHVDEGHTLDKLFLQSTLIFFWCNPFFWLIRKELHYIHEFIADKKAVANQDTEAFAAMILQSAYPKQFAAITNPFFQKSIKRRIVMLTKNHKSGMTYFSRIVALPLLATIVLAFTVRTEDSMPTAMALRSSLVTGMPVDQPLSDTLPKKKNEITAVDVRKSTDKKGSEITITYTDGSKETMTGEEAEKRGLINNSGYGNITKVQVSGGETKIRDTSGKREQPLYIVDGKEIKQEEIDKIKPDNIEAINVLKDKHATDKYGDKGKNGVIEITLKKGTDGRVSIKDVIVPNSNNVIVKDVVVSN